VSFCILCSVSAVSGVYEQTRFGSMGSISLSKQEACLTYAIPVMKQSSAKNTKDSLQQKVYLPNIKRQQQNAKRKYRKYFEAVNRSSSVAVQTTATAVT